MDSINTHNIMDSINDKHIVIEEDNIVTFETLNNSEECENLCYFCDYIPLDEKEVVVIIGRNQWLYKTMNPL